MLNTTSSNIHYIVLNDTEDKKEKKPKERTLDGSDEEEPHCQSYVGPLIDLETSQPSIHHKGQSSKLMK